MSDRTGIVLIKHKKVSRRIHKKAFTDDLKDWHYFYNI